MFQRKSHKFKFVVDVLDHPGGALEGARPGDVLQPLASDAACALPRSCCYLPLRVCAARSSCGLIRLATAPGALLP